MKITYNLDLTQSLAPLYCQHDGQTAPQAAYVEIDPFEKLVSTVISAEIGNAVPTGVRNGRVYWLDVPSEAHGRALDTLLRSDFVQALIKRICDGYSDRWDGSNVIGSLDDDATNAMEALEGLLHDVETVPVWTAEEWLADPPGTELPATMSDSDVRAYATDIAAVAEADGNLVTGLEDYLRQCRDRGRQADPTYGAC